MGGEGRESNLGDTHATKRTLILIWQLFEGKFFLILISLG